MSACKHRIEALAPSRRKGPKMRRRIAHASLGHGLCIACAPLWAADLSAPSGQVVTLYDVVLEADTGTARFLFLAPRIGGSEGLSYTDVQGDFAHLCKTYAIPALQANGWDADEVVISLADREVALGVITPEATQFFEPFRGEGAACLWEVF